MDFSDSEKYLMNSDPILGSLIQKHGSLPPPPQRDYFEALSRSIIGQQISTKAAAVIFERYKSVTHLEPVKASRLNESEIRSIRTSQPKIRYLRNLADYFVHHHDQLRNIGEMSDEDVVTTLTAIHGIGRWSAEMFLMITLRRADVFAVDDRGLHVATETVYKRPFTKKELKEFSKRWSPYRSTASFHLWQTLRSTPIMDEI